MRFILPILVIVLLLLFPQRVYCAEYIEVNFIEFDALGNHWFNYIKVPSDSGAHVSVRASTALNYLFTLNRPSTFPYPPGIQVLNIRLIDCHLIASLYIPEGSYGGTMLERIYLGQALKALLNLEGVEQVSIIADTPEGLSVREAKTWTNLFYGIISPCLSIS